MSITATHDKLSPEERSEILNRLVVDAMSKGWRVESQTQANAQLVKGHRTNHILHLILTIITLGAWALVWISMVIFGGEKRKAIAVNEYGQY